VTSISVPPWVRRQALLATAAVVVLLTVFSQRYGYERDELYFRMLRPAWGYVDQPPLVPLLAHGLAALVDQPWALRLPSTLAVGASVLVVSLLTRELGGGRAAQTIAVWTYAGSGAVLVFGHVLLTSTFDLLTWPLITLLVARALLRDEGRWWVWAGLVAGLATYDKLLVSWLLLGLAVGLLLLGPRRVVWSPPVLLGVAVALVVALPNLVYQVAHGWPQLTMGKALAAHNAADVRTGMVPLLVLVLGPPLVPIWVAGFVGLLRRPEWRPVRCVAVAFVVVLVLTFMSGTQPYYPTGLLVVLLAAGAVPTAALVARSRVWWWALVVAVSVNACVSAVIGLPLLPVGVVGSTPVPGVNQTVADQVGWPAYVAQVARVHDGLPAADRAGAVVVTSNYGEAGAVARYGSAYHLPAVFSAQNALYDQARPPAGTTTVVFVGGELPVARPLFRSCIVVARLDNGVDVDNEEQGQPVAVCRGPRVSWPEIWRRLRHLD
jgi:4-amino-4-deoxy-L-arabinose transferase-like glycosyltransferase